MTKLLIPALWLLGALAAAAAPLAQTAAVHTRPDPAAPTLTFLRAGSSPTLITDPAGATPEGWLAVRIAGPFEVYVENKQIGKSLDVEPGTAFHQQPRGDSPVLSRMEPGDKTSITGLHGRWTQIQLEKDIVGYVRVAGGAAPATPAPIVVKDIPTATPAPAPAPLPAARPAQVAPRGDGGSSVLPRLFQGRFVSSKRPFAPRRPYDWQLNDGAGVRYAYLDITKLLLTDQIEKYVDHVVVVYGTPKPMPGGQDIVIEVESLQLK